jgi:hypothetical protein
VSLPDYGSVELTEICILEFIPRYHFFFFGKAREGPALIKAKIDWGFQFYKEEQTKEAPGHGLKHLTLRPSLYQTKPENELEKFKQTEATTRKEAKQQVTLIQTKELQNTNKKPNRGGAKGSFR